MPKSANVILVFLVGVLAGAVVLGMATDSLPVLRSRTADAPAGIPTSMAPGGQVREFRLEAKPAKWEIFPKTVTDAWTYNGTVPGPELRVREGDLVRVIVTNHLPVPTTIHWHGVDLPWKMDGVPGVTQQAIEPAKTFTYEFIASPAGTRMYHSHQDANIQMELGLYGALIVEPRHGPKYDVERTIILDERALDVTPQVALGQADVRGADSGNGRGGAFHYDLFLMNGKAGSAIPVIAVKRHQRVLLRVINLGNLPHSMHLHGHTFTVVATDGNPVPPGARFHKDTVTLGPGERADLEVFTYNPGVWMFHCHMPNHGENGMMTVMQYEGFTPVGEHSMLPALPHAPLHTRVAVPEVAARLAPVQAFVHGDAVPAPRPTTLPMADNRFVPATLYVRRGAAVRWVNRGQNVHTTTSLDGLWDSPGLDRKQAFTFTFIQPGAYRYVCRQHLRGGMVGTIIVK